MDLKRDLEPFFLGGVFRSMDSISFSVNVLRPIRAENIWKISMKMIILVNTIVMYIKFEKKSFYNLKI